MKGLNRLDAADADATTGQGAKADSASNVKECNRLLNIGERLANFGHWRFDPRSMVFEASLQARTIAGWAADEAIHIGSALGLIEPTDRRLLLRSARRARAGEKDVSCQLRLRRQDHKLCYAVVQIELEEDEQSDSPALLGVIRDVTELVAIEDRLVAMRDRAEAETRAKSEFLSTMSHEIRTPMTGVLGLMDLLAGELSEEERDRYLCAMRQSAELLMTVLDRVLDFSKAESGMIELQNEHFDLQALARRTVQMFEIRTSKKGVLLELLFDRTTSPIVVGDPIRIQQVMINLISNAVKFTDKGRVTVTIKAQPANDGLNLWHVSVADTGVGIELSMLNQIFEPFIQVGQQHSGGTGLGLAISRRLVQVMNGKTGVESVAGSGSTFWFQVELPKGSAAVAADPGQTRLEETHCALHLLVAEDNLINQMLIAAILRGLGHIVTCVSNGREAVEAARASSFDCIIMDMQMPEMDGIAATHAIRTSGGRNAAVSIIALTADAAPERRRFYDNVGLTGFLTKPVCREDLRRQLASLPLTMARQRDPPQPSAIAPERVAELEAALGKKQVDDLLRMLGSQLGELFTALREAVAEGRVEDVRRQAHDLCGAAANLGADELASAARAVEKADLGPQLLHAMNGLEVSADAVVLCVNQLTHAPESRRA